MKRITETFVKNTNLESAFEYLSNRDLFMIEAPLSSVTVRSEGDIIIENGPVYGISQFAANQLARKAGIPTKITDFPDELAAQNFNSFLANKGSLAKFHICDNTLVGVTSAKTNDVNSIQLLEKIQTSKLLESFPSLQWWTDQKGIRFRFVSDKFSIKPRLNDPINFGVDIWNEEFSDTGIGLAGSLYRLICTNGAVSTIGDALKISLRKSKWKGSDAQLDLIFAGISDSIEFLSEVTENFSKLVGVPFEIPELDSNEPDLDYLKPYMKFMNLPFAKYSLPLVEAMETEEPSLYGLYNAVTRLGRDSGYPSIKEKFEMAGFKLLANVPELLGKIS